MASFLRLVPNDAATEEAGIDWPIERCRESATLRNLLEDIGDEAGSVPLPNIDSAMLGAIGDVIEGFLSATDSTTREYTEALRARMTQKDQPVPPSNLVDPRSAPIPPEWLIEAFTRLERSGPEALFEFFLGANYLDMPLLTSAVAHFIANKVKQVNDTPGLDHEEKLETVRRLFNVVNDFEPEEYERLKQESAWALNVQAAASVPADEI